MNGIGESVKDDEAQAMRPAPRRSNQNCDAAAAVPTKSGVSGFTPAGWVGSIWKMTESRVGTRWFGAEPYVTLGYRPPRLTVVQRLESAEEAIARDVIVVKGLFQDVVGDIRLSVAELEVTIRLSAAGSIWRHPGATVPCRARLYRPRWHPAQLTRLYSAAPGRRGWSASTVAKAGLCSIHCGL